MNKDKKNIIINEVLNLLNYTDWEQINGSDLKKKYDLKNSSELKAIYKWLSNNYFIESYNSSFQLLKLLDLGLEVQESGGYLEYIKLQSDNNEYLIEKEKLKFEKLKLQKENLKYQESIRKKAEEISELTRKNLKLSNFDIKYRLLIFISTFIIGLFTEYFTDFLEFLESLIQQ